MLSRLLRQLLYVLVHFVVNVLVAVQNVYQKTFIKTHPPGEKVTEEEVLILLKNIPNMKRQIKHLVVIADTDCHSMNDLARLVIWSLVIGVPYISFYDVTGKLKDNDETFFFEVQKNKKGIPGCVKWSDKPNLNGFSNGGQANSISINIFSYSDGKPKIAQCIKNIASDTSIHKKKNEEVTAEEFNKYLSLEYPPIPDPDVILYTGPLCCTFGFLPWQIRLTEFIPLSLSHNINIYNYLGALYKYSKCDQRFGK